jgi:hypothetical protein
VAAIPRLGESVCALARQAFRACASEKKKWCAKGVTNGCVNRRRKAKHGSDAGTGSPHSRFPASADQTSIIIIATAKHFDEGCRCGVCSARRVDGRQSECLLLVWCERRLKTNKLQKRQLYTKQLTHPADEHTNPKSKAGGAAMAWWCSCARAV